MVVTSCLYDESLGMFRVTDPRGKTLSSRAYGVLIDTTKSIKGNKKAEYENDDDDEEGIGNNNNNNNNNDTSNSGAVNHLFIEEVIYLKESELLNVYKKEKDNNNNNNEKERIMETWELYDILEKQNVPLATYLAYSYLRSQFYIVLRHRDRKSLLSSTDEEEDDNNKQIGLKGVKNRIIKERQMIANAPSPKLLQSDYDDNNNNNIPIAFDVYKPNKYFQKTNILLNLPDFVVIVTLFHDSDGGPKFDTIVNLLQYCENICISSVRLAVVSDGGSVLMYGLGLNGAPDISK